MKLIIYKNTEGRVSIVNPIDMSLDIHHVAKLSVPFGVGYKIIDSSDLPKDKGLRDAWTVDEKEMTDGIGGMK